MLDGNTAAMNDFHAKQDRIDDLWDIYNRSLDKEDLIHDTIEYYRQDIIDDLVYYSADEDVMEVVQALMEAALYKGKRSALALDDAIKNLPKFAWFNKLVRLQKERDFEAWLDEQQS